jgi:hypothetical protein
MGKNAQTTGTAPSTGAVHGRKATASGKQGIPVTGSTKQGSSTAGVSPSSKTTNTKNASTAKAAAKTAPVVKVQTPKIVPKKPSKADLVVAAKASSRISSGGRRDPFVSPIRTVTPTVVPTGPNCSTGKRCLAINELVVQGTAKDTDGRMMAIVASSAHRAYFLRENDQVFNGTVQKITSDSVIFRESYVDNLGRQNTHEIVKKINPS